jgi:hypothetical protein
MHILLVTFQLDGMAPDDLAQMSEEFASHLVGTPGLISKVYLTNPATNTYGGLYTWQDRGAMEQYLQSDLIAMVKHHPQITNIIITDYGVQEGPTRINKGWPAAA